MSNLTRCLLLVLFCGTSPAVADVRLPNVINDNMVLQRETPLQFWGWADAGERVTVTLAGNQAAAEAGDNGRWKVTLPAMPAGGPHQVVVRGKNEIVLDNVLVGEVWVCSGQSNMQWPVQRADNAREEIAAADYPGIRLFYVPRVPAGTPQDDVSADWTACTPQTAPIFSAVAYFFGRTLHRELDVPVGLINTSWGGTRIEPWTPPVGFKQVDALTDISAEIEQKNDAHAELVKTKPNAKHPLADRRQPTGLYNGMVHGLVPFAIRGAIWYQGEANRLDGMLYHEKMKALIGGWRAVWDQGDFPFLFVQLAPFRYRESAENLPKIWEAQTATLAVPNTGMAVITDIGNLDDIHPTNKQDVGKRLALWALAKTYGHGDVVYSGPLYKSMKIEGDHIRISFDHTAGKLASRDGKPLTWFTIAGSDGEFVEAEAKIDGETVVVSSDEVDDPKAVRFGWHQEAEPNLINGASLPAGPFRTDRPD